MQSDLTLLMRDGAIRVSFAQPLSPDQCAEFLELVQRSKTQRELCNGTQEVVERWGIAITCEEIRV